MLVIGLPGLTEVGAVIAVILTSSVAVVATTIAVVKTETEIVIAADSLIRRNVISLKSGRPVTQKTIEISTCKVRHKDGMVAALTGRHPPDLLDQLIDHLTQDVEAYNSVLVAERIGEFRRQHNSAIMELNPDWKIGDLEPVTYVVGFFEDGKPALLEFPTTTDNPDVYSSGHIAVLGNNTVLDLDPGEYAVGNVNSGLDLHRTLERIVVRQAQLTPDKVREPVSVLSVTASGARWVKDGKCR